MSKDKKQRVVYDFGNWRTLPLISVFGRAKGTIPGYGKGEITPAYAGHSYHTEPYSDDQLRLISKDWKEAVNALECWRKHWSEFVYFIQFQDDTNGSLIAALERHTQLIGTILDARVGLGAKEIWDRFDVLIDFRLLHQEYRADKQREKVYDAYSARLDEISRKGIFPDRRLLDRIKAQINAKANSWGALDPIHGLSVCLDEAEPVSLFISYCYKDEHIKDSLINHLYSMKHQGLLKEWHDRCITAGSEWGSSIDTHLESSEIILLLISSDFIASHYCYDIEMKRAMEKHESRTARVIPVILRSCDWSDLPCGKLQALPKDGKAATTWPNLDEALRNVAIGIRRAINESRAR